MKIRKFWFILLLALSLSATCSVCVSASYRDAHEIESISYSSTSYVPQQQGRPTLEIVDDDHIVVVAENNRESDDTITFRISGFEHDFTIFVRSKHNDNMLATIPIAVEDGSCTPQNPGGPVVTVDEDGSCRVTWDPPADTPTDIALVWAEGPPSPGAHR